MTDLYCLNTIIPDNLAIFIDLTNQNSWNLNTGLTAISLNKWNNAISDNIFLYDFGLTAFDNGRVNKMYDTLTILPTDTKLKMYRVGYNTPTGGTFYDGYGITGVTGASATTYTTIITGSTGGTGHTGTSRVAHVTSFGKYTGNFFQLNGGYLEGFFKLKNYNFELFPPRYGKGLTIETIVRITPESFNGGYFYFMGARAEDKYVPEFSGECITYTATTTIPVSNVVGQAQTRTINTIMFSGVTTSEDNFLNNYIYQDLLLQGSATNNFFRNAPVPNFDLGINGNAIGFYLSPSGSIGYTLINKSGVTESNESINKVGTGWTIIDIVFTPYEVITDKQELKCADVRLGDFIIYVNGRRLWKVPNFQEFWFSGFKTQREKQLGVPYNISWGGGSFGLKNSYHYDLHTYPLFEHKKDATGFTFTVDPFWSDPICPPPPLPHNITATTITGNSTTFVNPIDCSTGTTAATVLQIHNMSKPYTVITASTIITGATIITGHTGGTGHTGTTFITGYTTITGTTIAYSATTLNQYNIQYNPTLKLLSNRDYIFTVHVFAQNVFQPYQDGVIGMFFSGQTPITIVEQNPLIFQFETGNTWTTITYKIRTEENTGLTDVKVGLYLQSNVALVPDFYVYFEDFNYNGADVLKKDKTKDNELIQEIYDKSFIGGIQKLRIYDNGLNSQEVLHNALIEAKNPAYGFQISAGGRLIYK